jgi:tetratricopeptide (TPR) repeat protein
MTLVERLTHFALELLSMERELKTDPPIEASAGAGSTVSKEFAGARPHNPEGLQIAQARVAAELFGIGESGGVGRFQLLNRLGAGGMGVIYAAYDPELERTVAVKLLHVPDGGAGTVAEAKALARLSHPNVVPIFDVGYAGEHVYIVMELVLGKTLRHWVARRSVHEILKAYRQAGEALVAAHETGLVHRDFKPDNAIMGDDGRVRVVDFGLACEDANQPRSFRDRPAAAGTPRYMAPEQIGGAAVTAAADQYSFCCALAEALSGPRHGHGGRSALPRWLQLVIERGRKADPHQRFPSMRELLRALARDPAAAARRWAAGGALALAGVAAFAAGRANLAARERVCEGGEASIGSVWGASGRDAALARISRLAPYGSALRPRLAQELAEHSRRWSAGFRAVCLARQRGAESDVVLDRRTACLNRGRAGLRSVAAVIESADADALPGVVLAMRALADPDDCSDLNAGITGVEPPPKALTVRVERLRDALEDARIQIAAGRPGPSRVVAAGVVASSRALSYKPLLAEALLAQGHATLAMDDRVAATPLLTEAFTLAFEAGMSSLAVEAWARRAWVRGTSIGGSESLAGLDVVEAVAANSATSAFARALLYNNVGGVEMALEHRDRARAAFDRAYREARGFAGPGSAELLNIHRNLGFTTDDPEARDRLLAEAEAQTAKLLGGDHPQALQMRISRGMFLASFAQASALLGPACAGLEAHDRNRASKCWFEIGFLLKELGDERGAVAAMQRVSSPAVEPGSAVTTASAYLHLWEGDAGRAARELAASLTPAKPDEPWWDLLERAERELALGRALRTAGDLRAAKRALGSSLAALRKIAESHPAATVDRRIGRARAELAKTLAAMGARASEIAAAAAPAAAWLRRAGGTEPEIRELDRLSTPTPEIRPASKQQPH